MSEDPAHGARKRAVLPALPPARPAVLDEPSPLLDALSLNFVIASRTAGFGVLDVGCGDGLATTGALERGAHVVAVDPDARRLDTLLARTRPEHFRRLRVQIGELPGLDFMRAHFSAVHCARVLHDQNPVDLRWSLRKFFRWLYPEGKLYLSTFSPAGAFWQDFRPEYLRRLVAHDPWPGLLREPMVHLLDESVLRRELQGAGFILEEMTSYELPWDPQHVCCSVIARCQGLQS